MDVKKFLSGFLNLFSMDQCSGWFWVALRNQLPCGIPDSVEELDSVRQTLSITNDFSLQYLDQDFEDFFTLHSAAQIQQLATVKVMTIDPLLNCWNRNNSWKRQWNLQKRWHTADLSKNQAWYSWKTCSVHSHVCSLSIISASFVCCWSTY